MKKFLTLILALAMVLSVTACGGGGNGAKGGSAYTPRFPTDYDANLNSWEQVDPGDEDVTITWFFDYAIANENLEDLIYRRTGVNVIFQSASTSDHSELNTMIADERLPDVVTLNDTSTRILLAEENYALPLNKLAEYYAPGMLKTVPADHWAHYKGSDGNTYALSSNFYSDADIKEMEELGAHEYAARDIAVRKDYLEAYIAHKKAENAAFDPDAVITKPSGFLDMCKWVKDAYGYTIANPTVCFSPFALAGDELSYTITALYEMFGYAPEDAEGNLVNVYDSAAFKEALKYMNTLYNAGLVSSQNFGWDVKKIGTEVVNGRPFAIIGGTQNTHFQQAKRELDGYDAATNTVPDANQYVTILLTNEAGDAPLLQSYNRKGVYQTMITSNCKREDRVIKVFDYLLSEQGQRECMYGADENYNFTLRPGETNPATGKASAYGLISTTSALRDKLPTMFKTGSQQLGIRRTSAFVNAAYGRMVSAEDGFIGIRHPVDWVLYQNKSTYFGYTYNNADFDFDFNGIDRKKLNKYASQQADIFGVWAEAVPKIVMANPADFERLFTNAVKAGNAAGAQEWHAVRNEMFKKYKQSRNMEFAFPKNRAGYVAPEVKLRGGLYELQTRPEYVYEVLPNA